MALYTAASIACALAPDVWSLIGLRLVQGAAGAAGIVIANAIVRDRTSGPATARLFASLMLVFGVAPVVAPIVGGQVLHVTSWRGVFLVLAALGAVLFAGVAATMPESLPVGRRHTGGLTGMLRIFGRLLRDRTIVGCALAFGLGAASMIAYIAGSPFVLQDLYGVSPGVFSVIFGANAAGIIVTSQVGRRLASRVGPRALLGAGLVMCTCGGLLLLLALASHAELALVLPPMWINVASMGLIFPNATAHALAEHGEHAGAAAALLGLAQYVFGAAVAPLVGLGGSDSGVPMALFVAGLSVAALLAFLLLVAPRASRRSSGDASSAMAPV
jgi:DHA1 family bicyclomycin/chloramphenicol resistance-like MFS transporter